MKIITNLVFFSLILFFPAILKAETPPAQQAVESFLEVIRAMEFPAKDAGQTQKANAFLDLEAMGQKALANHWQEATPEEQNAFMTLLWKLIDAVAYPKSRKFLADYKISYPKVAESGNGFEVHSIVHQQEQALDASVVFHLYQKDGQWKIDDVLLDDVSMSEDLKYQFDKIISESKFAGLLEKMRERLSKIEGDGASTPAQAA